MSPLCPIIPPIFVSLKNFFEESAFETTIVARDRSQREMENIDSDHPGMAAQHYDAHQYSNLQYMTLQQPGLEVAQLPPSKPEDQLEQLGQRSTENLHKWRVNRTTALVILLLVIVIIAAAVGGGVGASLAVKNAEE